MMTFFSPFHLLSVLAAIGLVLLLYAHFKRRSAWAKRCAIVSLMALNILQHLFKSFLYPHLSGNGFGLENTLYNVCAFLILLSPLMHFSPANSMRQAIAYIGSIAGIVAILVPFWFFGKDVTAPGYRWEYLRFWCCHALLFASSLLPVLWRGVVFNYLDSWKFALYFLAMLDIILLNDAAVLLATGAATPETLHAKLTGLNPIGVMGPPVNGSPFAILAKMAEVLSPPVFLGTNGTGYTPVLWYAFPLLLAVTAAGLLLGMITDRANFFADMRLLFRRTGTCLHRKRLSRDVREGGRNLPF